MNLERMSGLISMQSVDGAAAGRHKVKNARDSLR